MRNYIILFGIVISFLLIGCKEDPIVDIPILDTTPYTIDFSNFPDPNLPEDNKLTVEKVKLGKMLFYEPMLSKDNSQSCASCHKQEDGFSDSRKFSIGVGGLPGTRHAMSIVNLAWNTNGFFWDGRSTLLRHQALLPIQDQLEMDETLDNVIDKLSNSAVYVDQFARAYGDILIDTTRIALALEQFMLSIVSNNAKFDKFLSGEVELTPSEERGRQLFFGDFNPFFPEDSGAECFHCHGGRNFENDSYANNGLDVDSEFLDFGRENVTGKLVDRARFKVTTLRNIALTAPYMHDGRFSTLRQVINHYNVGIKQSSTLNAALQPVVDNGGLDLSEQDVDDLIAFLETLTDETYLTNPEYASPF
jgi:cytochrome c peroxidase